MTVLLTPILLCRRDSSQGDICKRYNVPQTLHHGNDGSILHCLRINLTALSQIYFIVCTCTSMFENESIGIRVAITPQSRTGAVILTKPYVCIYANTCIIML